MRLMCFDLCLWVKVLGSFLSGFCRMLKTVINRIVRDVDFFLCVCRFKVWVWFLIRFLQNVKK